MYLLVLLALAAADELDDKFDQVESSIVRGAGVDEMSDEEKDAHRANFKRHCEGDDRCLTSDAHAFQMYQGATPAVNAQLLSELAQQEVEYEVGYNEALAGLSRLDIFQTKLGIQLPDGYLSSWQEEGESLLELENTAPSAFDAREKWPECASVIGFVRDQGQCGSCWAHGTTSAFNDRVCIASSGSMTQLLSTQHVTSCCTDAYSNNHHERGCSGGWPKAAWEMFMSEGIVTGGEMRHRHSGDTCWPYESGNGKLVSCGSRKGKCLESAYPTPFNQDIVRAMPGTFVSYREHSRSQIQSQLMTHGPMSFCFKVCDSFMAYKGGVYDCNCGAQDCGHEMKLIGWGKQGSTSYWTTVNSWNTWWGDEGLVKFKFGSSCNLMLIEASRVASDAVDGGGDDGDNGGGGGVTPRPTQQGDMPKGRVKLRLSGSSECIKDGWGSSCALFTADGDDHSFYFKKGGECVDYHRDQQTFGIYSCHYGENQDFRVVGDEFCITLPGYNNLCVALYGVTPTPTLEPTNEPTNEPTAVTPPPTAEAEGVCRAWCGDHSFPWEGAVGKCQWKRCSGCSPCGAEEEEEVSTPIPTAVTPRPTPLTPRPTPLVTPRPTPGASAWQNGYSTRYSGCHNPYCKQSLSCSSLGNAAFFTSGSKLLGTAAVGHWGFPCGTCYEIEILNKCASAFGGPGCNKNANAPAVGKRAIVMAQNLCPECKKGHFDLCMDNNWGGTVFQGMDNPALRYRKVTCPDALESRLGCS